MLPRRLALWMLLLIPAFSAGLLPAHAARVASASGVALKQSDMSSGFKQALARAISISSFAHDYGVSASTATSKGLVTGYETRFGRPGTTTTGVLNVDDQAYAFRSSGGARWAYKVMLATTGSGRPDACASPHSRETATSWRSPADIWWGRIRAPSRA